MCNQKLIGAQRFNAGWGGDAGIKEDRLGSLRRRATTTATAHIRHQPRAVIPLFRRVVPRSFSTAINGIAPHARISAYKALWSTIDGVTASGFTSDLVAAIDQAVADGVDVINYSISGTLTNFLDPVEVSFLFAADANVLLRRPQAIAVPIQERSRIRAHG
jgi:hypothetical protein